MHDQLTLICIRNRSTLMFIFIVFVITIHYYEITDWNPKTKAKNASSSIYFHSFTCISVLHPLYRGCHKVSLSAAPLCPLVVVSGCCTRDTSLSMQVPSHSVRLPNSCSQMQLELSRDSALSSANCTPAPAMLGGSSSLVDGSSISAISSSHSTTFGCSGLKLLRLHGGIPLPQPPPLPANVTTVWCPLLL